MISFVWWKYCHVLGCSGLPRWRRKWQPTPVFLPGEPHGWRSLVGYSPRSRKESDKTERRHFHFHRRALGFPGGASGTEPTCQCMRHKRRGFNPWVRKIPWRRAWQPTTAFLPGESHGFSTVHRVSESWTRLSDGAHAHTLVCCCKCLPNWK